MRKSAGLAFLIFFTHTLFAQDEGTIVRRERISRDNGIFLNIGPSVTLGKNIGDYNTGFSIEAGALKRINRIISIGSSLSYVQFKYDADVTKAGDKNVFVGGPYSDDSGTYYEGLYFDINGGNISLISLAANIKLNLIPITDHTRFSIYGFAKPFIASSSRSEVKGPATYLRNYGDSGDAADWQQWDKFDWVAGSAYVKENYGLNVSQDLKAENKITGGIYVGPGIEVFPANSFSAFFQVAVGYTFPITYVSTESFNNSGNQNNLDTFVNSRNIEKYPMLKKGFPSIGFQLGASYNF